MKPTAPLSLAKNARGVVYVEFLLCFIPVFLLFLGVVQLALISSAKLIVKHAAYRGARSASVVLADDPKFYDDEPVGYLGKEESEEESQDTTSQSSDTSTSFSAIIQPIEDLLDIHIDALPELLQSVPSGQRFADIRRAAYMPLSALAPSLNDLGELIEGHDGAHDLASSIGDQHASRLFTGLFVYNDIATALRFPTEPKGHDFYEESVDPATADLTLRVTHLYRCGVPVVSSIICRSIRDIGASYLKDRVTDEEDSSDSELFSDLDHIPSRVGLAALLVTNLRVFVLREESTIATQWAPYQYRSQKQ